MIKRYKYHFLILLIGISWIFVLNKLFDIHLQDNICNDCDNYRESAQYLFQDFKTHYFRPIGTALIVGLPYLFGFDDGFIYKFSFLVNVLFWLGTALMLFNIVKYKTSSKTAFYASILFYSIISFVFINFHLLTESIFTFLMVTVAYFLHKFSSTKSFKYLSIALGLLLFSILVKPSVKFLSILSFLFFLKIIVLNYKRKSIIFILIPLTLLTFQYIKMKIDYGNFTLTYIDSVTYYNYLGSKAYHFKKGEDFKQETNPRAKYLAQYSYPEQRKIASSDMLLQIQYNPSNLVKAYFSNIFENTKTPNSSIETTVNFYDKSYYEGLKKSFSIVSKYQNRIFTSLGFLLSLFFLYQHKKNDLATNFMSFFILYTICISGISCSQGDRFHIVFFPFVIMLITLYIKNLKIK